MSDSVDLTPVAQQPPALPPLARKSCSKPAKAPKPEPAVDAPALMEVRVAADELRKALRRTQGVVTHKARLRDVLGDGLFGSDGVVRAVRCALRSTWIKSAIDLLSSPLTCPTPTKGHMNAACNLRQSMVIGVLAVLVVSPSAALAQTWGEVLLDLTKNTAPMYRCPEAVLHGLIIQKLGSHLYEVEMPLPTQYWGNGDRDGRAQTVVLETSVTDFESRGNFVICVQPRMTLRKLSSPDGFPIEVPQFYEDVKAAKKSAESKSTLAPDSHGGSKESLDESDIMASVLSKKAELALCVGKKAPETSGKIIMRWIVLPSGRVDRVGVADESLALADSAMARCLAETIKSLRFPKHQQPHAPILFPFKY